jgi:magnesium transporter
MQQTMMVGATKWIYIPQPDKEIIDALAQEYHFHEIIVNDLIEVNAQSKIDINSNNFFLTLTFTKYLPEEQRYVLNELDVIIGDDYIITTTSNESINLKVFFESFAEEVKHINGSYKSSPYYILYRIIDVFYDKTIKSLNASTKALLDIQDNIAYRKVEREVVEDLITEDLNKIFIKHNFLSQEDVIDDLVAHVKLFHEKHLNVYYNDLKVKLSKIVSTINVLSEKTDSLLSAYNTFVGIKNNDNVTRLTFVNAIFLPLMLLAGIGGMSEWSMIT